jgi:hypothetical protein
MPALSAVYPMRLCRNCGIETVVEEDAAPTMNIIRLAVAKLGF